MTHNALQDAPGNTGRKKERSSWPTASARVSEEELRLLDAAAYKAQVKRSDLIRDAALREARSILGMAA